MPDPRDLHMAINVALRRLGSVVPACNGDVSDCEVCATIASALAALPAEPAAIPGCAFCGAKPPPPQGVTDDLTVVICYACADKWAKFLKPKDAEPAAPELPEETQRVLRLLQEPGSIRASLSGEAVAEIERLARALQETQAERDGLQRQLDTWTGHQPPQETP